MGFLDVFQFASGSTAGHDHRALGKNNQDGLAVRSYPSLFIGVVTDGCGDPHSQYSEVGSRLGAALVVEGITRLCQNLNLSDPQASEVLASVVFWERVRQDVLAGLRVLALQMGPSFSTTVSNYFLFTTIAAVLTPYRAVFASIGDGTLIINGVQNTLGPFPNNAPPYLAYGLLDVSQMGHSQEQLHFQLQSVLPTDELDSFLIGCDGVDYLIASAQKPMPGKTELVGSVDQLWESDYFFTQPHLLSLWLTGLAKDSKQIDWENQRVKPGGIGLLKDDTTIIVGRRIKLLNGETS